MRSVDRQIVAPDRCTDSEVAAFCKLVRQGEEVSSQGLEGRVKTARSLVFLYVARQLAGLAALKRPLQTYRNGVFKKARVPDLGPTFDLELGWVFVASEHRGRGYSTVLSAAALSQRGGEGPFATTRADNIAMQKTLEHLGFRRVGDSWPSKQNRRARLLLYVASPNR